MTFHPLAPHPAQPHPAGMAIDAAIARLPDGGLHLQFRLHGAVDRLRLPESTEPHATDGLWQHTCCEAFIATVDEPIYHEFNLSSSGCWAVYRFVDYRERDTTWSPAAAPAIDCRRDGETLLLSADLPAELLPAGAAHLGLTAVAEANDGSKSYWALAHAAAQPDFHLAASFMLPLP